MLLLNMGKSIQEQNQKIILPFNLCICFNILGETSFLHVQGCSGL